MVHGGIPFRFLIGLCAGSLFLVSFPAAAFGVICCNVMINMPSAADWGGYSRDCSNALGKVSKADRDMACVRIAERGPVCQEAKAHCKECDPSLWSSFERKEKVAAELRKHALDQRRAATRMLEGHALEYVGGLPKDKVDDKLWDASVEKLEQAAREARGRIFRAGGQAALKGGTAAVAVAELGASIYKGTKIAEEWARYQEEARKADAKAHEAHRQAIADLEADLKQAPMCVAESRRKAEEERKVDRAKALIERWDNNQVLYRDPITKEALVQQKAVKRALEYLETGRMSDGGWRLIPAGGPLAQRASKEQEQAAEAAVTELDTAIASIVRMRTAGRNYLYDKRIIEAQLQSTFQEAAPLQDRKSKKK